MKETLLGIYNPRRRYFGFNLDFDKIDSSVAAKAVALVIHEKFILSEEIEVKKNMFLEKIKYIFNSLEESSDLKKTNHELIMENLWFRLGDNQVLWKDMRNKDDMEMIIKESFIIVPYETIGGGHLRCVEYLKQFKK